MNIILANWEKGQKKKGVGSSGKKLVQYLRMDYAIKDEINSNDEPLINSFSHFSKQLSESVQKLIKHNFTTIIGGDHSVAVGSIGGLLEAKKEVKVIWVDAHADINNFQTSISKNMHGMPVAFLLDLIKEKTVKEEFSWLQKLKSQNIVYIGLRDIDPPEKKILDDLNIRYYTMDVFKNNEIEDVVESALDYLDIQESDHIHLSLDVDGIDPKDIPSTGTPVPNGLYFEDIVYLLAVLKEYKQFQSMDLVELNLEIGSEEDRDRSLFYIKQLIDIL